MMPYVICHMMSSIDGKITDGGSVFDDSMKVYDEIHCQYAAEAWMCGRKTMEMFASDLSEKLPDLYQEVSGYDYIAKQKNENFTITADTKGSLRWMNNTIIGFNKNFINHLIILVAINTPKPYLQYLQSKGISYLFAGENEIDFKIAFSKLKEKFGINKLLLEGGGLINGSVLDQGLINEISLIVLPIVVNNSKTPALFESERPQINKAKFKLKQFKELENDAIWLNYLINK
jgi:riboflavin biosynthesis pyrimidine reductase